MAFSDVADEGDDAISLSSLSPPVFGADAEDNDNNDEVGDRNGHVHGNRCDRKIQRHRRRRRREREEDLPDIDNIDIGVGVGLGNDDDNINNKAYYPGDTEAILTTPSLPPNPRPRGEEEDMEGGGGGGGGGLGG